MQLALNSFFIFFIFAELVLECSRDSVYLEPVRVGSKIQMRFVLLVFVWVFEAHGLRFVELLSDVAVDRTHSSKCRRDFQWILDGVRKKDDTATKGEYGALSFRY